MPEFQRFMRNSFFLVVSYFLRFSSGLAIVVLVGRSVAKEDFGRFTFALTLASFFAVAADFGLPSLTIRDVARDHALARSYYRNILTLKTIFSLICFGGIVAFVNLAKYPPETRAVVYPVAAFTFIASLANYHYFLFRGLEQMQYEAASAIIHNGMLIAGVAVALMMPHAGVKVPVSQVTYGYLGSGIVSTAMIMLVFGRRAGGARLSFNWQEWKALLQRSSYFALYGMLGLVYMSIDTLMISKLGKNPEPEMAVYQAPVKLLSAGVFAVGIITNVYIPMLSRRFLGPIEEFKSLVHTLNRMGITVLAPIVVFPFMFSHEMMTFLFTAEYVESARVLQILCIGFLVWDGPPYGIVFAAMGRQDLNFYISAVCAVVNVVLNLIFIPLYYGPIAAASTTLATYVLMKILYIHYCRKHLGSAFVDYRYPLTLALCLAIAAGLKLSGLHVVPAGIVFCLVYAGAGFVLLLSPQEKKLCLRMGLRV